MTDKELLELAAKAAGWTGWQSKHGYWNVESPDGEKTTRCHNWNAYCQDTGEKLKEPSFADAIAATNWNPLADDGDALRLAVKLRIDIDLWFMKDSVTAKTHIGVGRGIPLQGEYKPPLNDHSEPLRTDHYAATRRAITRAAAALGEEMINKD